MIIIMMHFCKFLKIFKLEDNIFMKTVFINAEYYQRHFVSHLFLTGYMVSCIRLVVQSNACNFLCSSTYHLIHGGSDRRWHAKEPPLMKAIRPKHRSKFVLNGNGDVSILVNNNVPYE
jgi:hypothetical protein